MMETFKTNIFNNTFPMRCPQENCQKEVTENDLRAILSPEMFDKYQSHTLKAYADQHGQSVYLIYKKDRGALLLIADTCFSTKRETIILHALSARRSTV